MGETKIAVVVASAGRPEVVGQLLDCICTLPESPLCVVSVPAAADMPESREDDCLILVGVRGAAAQRNAALERIPPDTDYVFFFDDDALPRQDYITNAVNFLDNNPAVMAITGNVVADGAPQAREIGLSEAIESLVTSYANYPSGCHGDAVAHGKLYGCNFGVRWRGVEDLRFDERLPLYSWLEDYDYARRLLARGDIAALSGCIAVHRGSSSGGRVAHLRFGYSQVANPLYLMKKGSFTMRIMLREAMRPILKNVLFSIFPGPQRTWRRRRLNGNALALVDMIQRRMEPERILSLGK